MVKNQFVEEILLKSYVKGLNHEEYIFIKKILNENCLFLDYNHFLHKQELIGFLQIDVKDIDLKSRKTISLSFEEKDLKIENLNNLLDELESFPITKLLKISDSRFNSLLSKKNMPKLSLTLKVQGKFKEYSLIHLIKNLLFWVQNGLELAKLNNIEFLYEVNID